MTIKAVSASSKTDDWPFWMLVNENGLNVTRKVLHEMGLRPPSRLPFITRDDAMWIEAAYPQPCENSF